MDYLIPTAIDIPQVEIGHIESPSPHTPHGIKGVGEGGAIAPPAAIANAVADALNAIRCSGGCHSPDSRTGVGLD